MKTQAAIVARQCRLREWAAMIRDCNSRPGEMSLNDWCVQNSITRANYYYRVKEVRKACLDSVPNDVIEQSMKQSNAIVPVPSALVTQDATASRQGINSVELTSNGITLRVTEQTSTDLLAKVLGVIAHVK